MLFSLFEINFAKKNYKTMIKKSIEVLKALFFFGRNENDNDTKKGVKSKVNENSESSEEDWSYHYWLNLSC